MPSRSVSQSLNALPPGTVLRDYVIESELGSGGFSIVYLARHHLKSDWLYAIKEFLPAELAARARDGTGVRPLHTEARSAFEDGLRRFRDEAEQLRKFRNERYIVSCLNYFEENDTAYLVMDYDDGLPLSEFLRRREDAGQPFTEADLLAVVEPLLEGLAVVHRAGVLHRDIKPGNIFVRRRDDITGRPAHPVLIDFGAAKQNYLEQHSRSRAPYTPGYAAYEQVSSMGEVGPWTDLYALGTLMWRMVAGGCPGDSRLSVADESDGIETESPVWSPTPRAAEKRAYALHRERSDPMVPAAELGTGRFSPEVLAAIDRCLALYPENRVQDCGELRTLLDMSVQSVAASPEQSLSSRVDQRPRRSSDRRVKPDGSADGRLRSALRSMANERAHKKASATRWTARLLVSGAIGGLILSAIVGYRHASELPMYSAPVPFLQAYYNAYRNQLPQDMDVDAFIVQFQYQRPALIEDMAEYMYNDRYAGQQIPREEFEERSGIVAWREDQPNWVEALVEDLWHRLVTDAEQVASIQEPPSTPVERDLDPSTGEPAPPPVPVGASADGAVSSGTAVDAAESSEHLIVGGSAILVIDTIPSGASVSLLDRNLGVTPLELSGLRAGRYEITLDHPAYEVLRLSDQRLMDGEVLRIERILTPATGNLTVLVQPRGAWIELAGQRLAEATPITLRDLPAGRIELTLGATEHRTTTVQVDVPRNGVGILEQTLEPTPYGTLILELDPPDAAVTLPDIEPPYRPGMQLLEGGHRVIVRRENYQTVERTVLVSGETHARVQLEMIPGSRFRDRLASSPWQKSAKRTVGLIKCAPRQVAPDEDTDGPGKAT